ncbi:MAG: hypothetical protein LBL49_09120 [Clostridiales Family XIII bacterium]|jgi:Flp pilus assembly protein TadB|nr:hypothetical protein [Clostridiales Family XIII bacterium]
MNPGTVNVIATALLYTVFTGSMLLLIQNQLKTLLLLIKTRRRLYAGSGAKPSGFEDHIGALLDTVFGGKVHSLAFITLSGLLFVTTLLVGLYNISAPTAAAISLISLVSPYTFVRIRAKSISRRGSQEGERLIAAFLNQYRINNYNVYETLEKLVANGAEFRVCKPCLFKLLLEIRSAGSSEKLRLATESFARTINTNWSRMLAYNIRLAAEQGMNVSPGIEDILAQLRDARVHMEERKRLNAESARMVIFLVPALYIGSMLLAVHFLGMTPATLMRNQIGTPEGFMLFVVIIFLFFINIVLIELVTNQKMDY